MKKSVCATVALLAWASEAHAEDVQVHASAGATHAVFGPQERELGTGGGGRATVELPVATAVGVQASGGGLVLSQGAAPKDGSIAQRSTGSAVFGTVGVRFHPLAARRVAGPWIDVNGGVAQTGDLARPAFDSHLGWDFRVAKQSRLDVGPFVGYTQIVQKQDSLRPDDARILWAGLSISIGAKERPARSAPAVEPPPPVRPAKPEKDGDVEAMNTCPDGSGGPVEAAPEEGCGAPIEIVDDHIKLDDVIHFEFDSPRIHQKSRRLVWRIADFIAHTPEIVQVRIEGHADAIGTVDYNQHLSEARAESTRAMLVEFGAPESKLVPVGYGKSRLVVQSQRREEKNRRVEFVVERVTQVARDTAGSAGKKGQP